MKNLFKQKLSIYIWWYAPLPIPSSPQTHSKLCSQWTTPLYHLFRQETYKFHFQEKWFWEPEKSISIVASQLNERNFVRFSRQNVWEIYGQTELYKPFQHLKLHVVIRNIAANKTTWLFTSVVLGSWFKHSCLIASETICFN